MLWKKKNRALWQRLGKVGILSQWDSSGKDYAAGAVTLHWREYQDFTHQTLWILNVVGNIVSISKCSLFINPCVEIKGCLRGTGIQRQGWGLHHHERQTRKYWQTKKKSRLTLLHLHFKGTPNLGQWVVSDTGSNPEASTVKGCAFVSGSLLVHTEVDTRVGAE